MGWRFDTARDPLDTSLYSDGKGFHDTGPGATCQSWGRVVEAPAPSSVVLNLCRWGLLVKTGAGARIAKSAKANAARLGRCELVASNNGGEQTMLRGADGKETERAKVDEGNGVEVRCVCRHLQAFAGTFMQPMPPMSPMSPSPHLPWQE